MGNNEGGKSELQTPIWSTHVFIKMCSMLVFSHH